MGLLGFPGEEELFEMLGIVSPEEQQKWAASRQAHQERKAQKQASLGTHATQPVLDTLRMDVRAMMQGTRVEEQRQARKKVRIITEQSVNADSYAGQLLQLGYDPEELGL